MIFLKIHWHNKMIINLQLMKIWETSQDFNISKMVPDKRQWLSVLGMDKVIGDVFRY